MGGMARRADGERGLTLNKRQEEKSDAWAEPQDRSGEFRHRKLASRPVDVANVSKYKKTRPRPHHCG